MILYHLWIGILWQGRCASHKVSCRSSAHQQATIFDTNRTVATHDHDLKYFRRTTYHVPRTSLVSVSGIGSTKWSVHRSNTKIALQVQVNNECNSHYYCSTEHTTVTRKFFSGSVVGSSTRLSRYDVSYLEVGSKSYYYEEVAYHGSVDVAINFNNY
jgi:hypothetical protein